MRRHTPSTTAPALILDYLTMLVSRRTFFFGSLALPAIAGKKKPEALRPGILLILVDELPAFMLGSYGNKQVHTPNLDLSGEDGHALHEPLRLRAGSRGGPQYPAHRPHPMQLGEAGALSAADVPLAKILPRPDTFPRKATPPRPCNSSRTIGGQALLLHPQLSQPAAALRRRSPKISRHVRHRAVRGLRARSARPQRADGKEMLRNILGNVRKAAAALTALDDTVGAVVDKLRARGLQDTTLVVFTAATGALWGRHGLWDSANASDPPNMFDEAVATPILLELAGAHSRRGPPSRTGQRLRFRAHRLRSAFSRITAAQSLRPQLRGAGDRETPAEKVAVAQVMCAPTWKIPTWRARTATSWYRATLVKARTNSTTW